MGISFLNEYGANKLLLLKPKSTQGVRYPARLPQNFRKQYALFYIYNNNLFKHIFLR